MAGRRPETDGATRAAPATEPVATRAAARGRHWPRWSPTATARSRFDLRLAGSRTLAAAMALKNEPSLNSRPEYTTGATARLPMSSDAADGLGSFSRRPNVTNEPRAPGSSARRLHSNVRPHRTDADNTLSRGRSLCAASPPAAERPAHPPPAPHPRPSI